MKKKKSKKPSRTKKTIKALHLDKPTSHGGWPDGHKGSFTDPHTPVNVQISDWLIKMGLAEDSDHARLSEDRIRNLIRKVLSENNI